MTSEVSISVQVNKQTKRYKRKKHVKCIGVMFSRTKTRNKTEISSSISDNTHPSNKKDKTLLTFSQSNNKLRYSIVASKGIIYLNLIKQNFTGSSDEGRIKIAKQFSFDEMKILFQRRFSSSSSSLRNLIGGFAAPAIEIIERCVI